MKHKEITFFSFLFFLMDQPDSPELLNDLDVVQVDAGGGGRVDDAHDGVHAHGCQQAGVLRHHLGAQRRGGTVEQRLTVAQLHRPAHGRQHLHTFLHRLLEGLRDDGGVDAWSTGQRVNISAETIQQNSDEYLIFGLNI